MEINAKHYLPLNNMIPTGKSYLAQTITEDYWLTIPDLASLLAIPADDGDEDRDDEHCTPFLFLF